MEVDYKEWFWCVHCDSVFHVESLEYDKAHRFYVCPNCSAGFVTKEKKKGVITYYGLFDLRDIEQFPDDLKARINGLSKDEIIENFLYGK